MATFSDFLSRQKKDHIEFLEDDPISGNLVFTFSLGGRRDYQLPADEEGSCFHARATTKTARSAVRQHLGRQSLGAVAVSAALFVTLHRK